METGAGDHHHQQHFLKSSNEDDDDDYYSLETRDGKRVVGEMDLFPNGNLVEENFLVQVNKEITSEQGLLKVKPDNHDLDIGLNLGGNNSHISVVEDERSRRTEQDQKQRKNMVLADLKTELDRMNIENQRLRSMLNQVNSNYHALQMHLASFVHQQQRDQSKAMTIKHDQQNINGKPEEKQGGALVARQFMEIEDHSLSTNYEERSQDSSMMSPSNIVESLYNKSPKRGNGDTGNRGTWVPNKVLKLHTSAEVDEERAETTSITRKARVSVRTRFEASTISDGCQWRKYGRKFAKGNPCPRSYYRCSMGSCCPVRKQVQRSVEDHTILITTYEGHHNHPLPPAAVAMASATSATASMLLSGSTSSPVGIIDRDANSSSSLATISSTSSPFPTTITLDLTRNNPVSGVPSQRSQGLNPLSNTLPDQERYFHVLASKLLDQLATNNRQIALSPDNAAQVAAAITAEPNFTAAVVAAITSIMGSALT